MQEPNFNAFLNKYSHYLKKETTDRKTLLGIGKQLFGTFAPNSSERPSYTLLKAKEDELVTVEEKTQTHTKSLGPKAAAHIRAEQPQNLSQDFAEEVMVLQDKNGLLLARRKALEKQRNRMNDEYGALMEKSIQQKVQLKLQMQKLKAELDDALSPSRPAFMANQQQTNTKPVMQELQELNQQVLDRIKGFKMSVSTDTAYFEKAVLDRYKPKMEKKLGQIYPHAEYLPVTQVHEKFNSASEKIEHKMREIETELKNEHERNEQLQSEAKQLADQVAKQTEEVNIIKKRNAQFSREIALLQEIATKPLSEAKERHESLMNVETDTEGLPSSARAVIMTTGNEKKKIRRSPSAKFFDVRDTAIPQVRPIQDYIEDQKQRILDLLHT